MKITTNKNTDTMLAEGVKAKTLDTGFRKYNYFKNCNIEEVRCCSDEDVFVHIEDSRIGKLVVYGRVSVVRSEVSELNVEDRVVSGKDAIGREVYFENSVVQGGVIKSRAVRAVRSVVLCCTIEGLRKLNIEGAVFVNSTFLPCNDIDEPLGEFSIVSGYFKGCIVGELDTSLIHVSTFETEVEDDCIDVNIVRAKNEIDMLSRVKGGEKCILLKQ